MGVPQCNCHHDTVILGTIKLLKDAAQALINMAPSRPATSPPPKCMPAFWRSGLAGTTLTFQSFT